MAITAITLTRVSNEPIKFIASKKERVIQVAFTSDGAATSATLTDASAGNIRDVSQLTTIERAEFVELPHETSTPTPTDILRARVDVSAGMPGTLYLGSTGTNTKVYTGLLNITGY